MKRESIDFVTSPDLAEAAVAHLVFRVRKHRSALVTIAPIAAADDELPAPVAVGEHLLGAVYARTVGRLIREIRTRHADGEDLQVICRLTDEFLVATN